MPNLGDLYQRVVDRIFQVERAEDVLDFIISEFTTLGPASPSGTMAEAEQ